MATAKPCRVCTTVDQFELIDLDTLMGDPSAWPASIWGAFERPAGALPAAYRRFGAVEMGLAWIADHQIKGISRSDVRRHYQFDVPKIGVTPDELVTNGLIARGKTTDVATINPLAYLEYYNTGIEVGIAGLKQLQQHIDALVALGEEVPLALIKMAVDAGAKLSMSQAAIKAAGKPWGDEGDADEGFRAGSAPAPSPRMGHHRIRKVEGVDRPVRDTGPADRAEYSERAAQEGGAGLPHP